MVRSIFYNIYICTYIYMCSACKNVVQDSAHIFTP